MDIQEVKELIARYNSGEASAEEKIKLENWYGFEVFHQRQNPEIEDYVRIKAEVWEVLAGNIVSPTEKAAGQIKVRKLWPRIAAVAAAVIMVVFGTWFYTSRPSIVDLQSQTITRRRNDQTS